mmetsp:Transcript_28840/g.46657  ORF Transcript_28840/g.46657 Transcript_28840/m.46657 type:complete len:2038 (+) Transcript_28840:79-6192(+)
MERRTSRRSNLSAGASPSEQSTGVSTRSSSRKKQVRQEATPAVSTPSKRQKLSASLASRTVTKEPSDTVTTNSAEVQENPSEDPLPVMETNSGDKSFDRSSKAEEKQKEPDKEAEDRNNGVSRNLSNASTALHGLLRKLGAGIDDLFPSASMGHSRLRTLLTILKTETEDHKQLECLSELCDILSMGTEESMSSVSIDAFVPILVGLLNAEHNPDIMLLASRALTHLMDALPSSCAAIVHYGAVPAFCTKLLTIEYIDLAEQSLQAIEKISHDHPNAVLKAGGLMAVLSYLDFFPLGVQRVAVSTAANLCRQVPSECFDMVVDTVPLITNLLQYSDQKVVECACLCFARLCDSFADSDKRLQAIASHGLVDHLMRTVSMSNGPVVISPSTYTLIIRLLATLARGSPSLTQQLLEKGITTVLQSNLVGEVSLSASSSPSSPAASSRSTEQLFEILSLANELLPPLPKNLADLFALLPDSTQSRLRAMARFRSSSSGRPSLDSHGDVNMAEADAAPSASAASAGAQASSEGSSAPVRSSREEMLVQNPVLLQTYAECLFPTFLQVFNSSVNPAVRHKCLSAIVKVLQYSNPASIESILRNVTISSFTAGLLTSHEMSVVLIGLAIAEILMSKLPDIFRFFFRKEGVVFEIDRLVSTATTSYSSPSPPNVPSPAAPVEPPPSEASAPASMPAPATPSSAAKPTPSASSSYSLRSTPSRRLSASLAAVAMAQDTTPPSSRKSASAFATTPPFDSKSSSSPIPPPPPKADEPPAFRRWGASAAIPIDTSSSSSSSSSSRPIPIASSSSSAPSGGAPHHQHSVASSSSSSSELRSMVLTRAREFQDKYFGKDADSGAGSGSSADGLTDAQKRLRALSKKLVDLLDTYEPMDRKLANAAEDGEARRHAYREVIVDIRRVLSEEDNVSTFEFVSSGLIHSFLDFLTRLAPHSSETADRYERLKLFAQVFADPDAPLTHARSNTPASLGVSGPITPMLCLVRTLQSTISSQERFPILLHEVTSSSSSSSSASSSTSTGAALKNLTHPFKLRLQFQRPGGSDAPSNNQQRLKDYAANIVLIEPLATINAVEDFLWPKVKPDSPPPPAPTPAATATAALATTTSTTSSTSPNSSAKSNTEAPSAGTSPPGSAGRDNMRETRSMARKASLERAKQSAAAATTDAADAAAAAVAAATDAAAHAQSSGEGGVGAFPDAEDFMEYEEYEEEVAEDEADGDGDGDGGHGEGEGEGDEDEEDLFGSAAHRRQMVSTDSVHDLQLPTSDAEPAAHSISTSPPKHTSSSSPPPPARSPPSRNASPPPSSTPASRPSQPPSTSTASQHHMSFYLDGHLLPFSMTIFQAIQKYGRRLEADYGAFLDEDQDRGAPHGAQQHIWGQIYTITYRGGCSADELTAAENAVAPLGLSLPNPCPLAGVMTSSQAISTYLPPQFSSSSSSSVAASSTPTTSTTDTNIVHDAIGLMRILHAVCVRPQLLGIASTCPDGGSLVSPLEFVCQKLSAKLMRQLQDPLTLCSGSLPEWCHTQMASAPFLFSFECRRTFLYSTSFGISRALHRLQQRSQQESQSARSHNDFRLGRIQRQKVRISRFRILDSAVKVMELYSGQRAVLEVEYFGEAGTGLGPTLEFYTLVSHELQRVDLKLWRFHDLDLDASTTPAKSDSTPTPTSVAHSDAPVSEPVPSSSDTLPPLSVPASAPNSDPSSSPSPPIHRYVDAKNGLFPAPLPYNSDHKEECAEVGKVTSMFTFMGRFVAKALQDSRMVDLSFSPAFLRLVLGDPVTFDDLRSVDPALHATLARLRSLVSTKKAIEASSLSPEEKSLQVEGLCLDGAPIDSLCLDFVAPGYPNIPLIAGGENTSVSIWNVEEYTNKVAEHVLDWGVKRQVDAFKAGFNQIFPIANLRPFSYNEIETMMCGQGEKWDVQMLIENTKCDHGYAHASRSVKILLEILSEMTPDEQRQFLRFTTGSPRLPPGGLSSLSPKLTIVRRNPEAPNVPDDYLPTVMTCANYLKLPDYSSKDVMRQKLMMALREGQGSFHLS